MFRYWFFIVVAMSGILFLAACTQQKEAPVVFEGGKFFGRNANYDSKGNEIAKYSKENPAILDEAVADKYISKDETYGVAAEVDSIGTTDLSSPEIETKEWNKDKKWNKDKNINSNIVDDPAPIEYANDPIPNPYPLDNTVTIDKKNPSLKEGVGKNTVDNNEAVSSNEIENDESDKVIKKSNFVWPVRGKIISKFGDIQNGKHNKGINIAARSGEPIRSAADGVVVYAGNKLANYGNLVIIKHNNGYLTAYAHAKDIVVRKGEDVIQGQLIGFVGDTGEVTSPQLHFAIRKNKSPQNPIGLLGDD